LLIPLANYANIDNGHTHTDVIGATPPQHASTRRTQS
jgi:hypothetical protein